MRPEIQTLKAEINADLQAIEEIYAELDRLAPLPDSEDKRILTGYFLHNLYTAFESVFQWMGSGTTRVRCVRSIVATSARSSRFSTAYRTSNARP